MSSARVLLIEDDRFLRKACEVGLKKQGFVVLTAENGELGIQQAITGSADIILLDMLMPGLSGLETLKVLKSEEHTREIPVVILSNSSVEEDIQKARDMGAVGYLVKASLSLQELGQQVRSFLDKDSDS